MLTILQTEHLFSAPFSPHEVQNSASMKPTWPVMACVSTDSAVGSLPCERGRDRRGASVRHRATGPDVYYYWDAEQLNTRIDPHPDSRSPRGRCSAPAAAAGWRRSKGTCGCTRGETSLGTQGSRLCPDPSASCRTGGGAGVMNHFTTSLEFLSLLGLCRAYA